MRPSKRSPGRSTERIAAEQDAYLADADMVVVDGYIGSTRSSAPAPG